MPENNITQLQNQEDPAPEQASSDGSSAPTKGEQVQLDPERIRYLQSIALGPTTIRYKGSLVVPSDQIQRDIAASGIPDPQIRW